METVLLRNSLAVQWLGLPTFTAEGLGGEWGSHRRNCMAKRKKISAVGSIHSQGFFIIVHRGINLPVCQHSFSGLQIAFVLEGGSRYPWACPSPFPTHLCTTSFYTLKRVCPFLVSHFVILASLDSVGTLKRVSLTSVLGFSKVPVE